MASATSDLLGFEDFKDYEESPTISVNSPKKVSNGKKKLSWIFKTIQIKKYSRRSNAKHKN